MTGALDYPWLGQHCYGGVRLLDAPCPANTYRLDRGALPMILEYHRHGIKLDKAHFASLKVRLESKARDLLDTIRSILGPGYKEVEFNPNSGDQVARMLFDVLGLTPSIGLKFVPSGKRPVVDDEVLAALAGSHPVIKPMVEYRQTTKLMSTYVEPLPTMVDGDSRLHTEFMPTRAATGRLASKNPNLQNIPTRTKDGVEIRNGFVADSGLLLGSIDLSQIEMVMAGVLSQDELLCRAFKDNLDIHTLTAVNVFDGYDRDLYMGLASRVKLEEEGRPVTWTPEEKALWKAFKTGIRLPSKTIGFGILYGQTAAGAQSNILAQGGPYKTIEECDGIITRWFKTYSGVTRWMAIQHSRAKRYGMVWDCFGRARRIPEAVSRLQRVQAAGLRQAGNMPIQASAQGVLKLAMAMVMPLVQYYRDRGAVCRPLLQIHDELIFELSRDIAAEFCQSVADIMKSVVRFPVPIGAAWSVAERWGELK